MRSGMVLAMYLCTMLLHATTARAQEQPAPDELPPAPPESISTEQCDADCDGQCGTGCSLVDRLDGWFSACEEPYELIGTTSLGPRIGGWMQWGYHSESNGLFNSHDSRFNLHQLWLFAEKQADGSTGLDFGYRFDMLYGVDAQDTQAFGNNPGGYDFLNGFDHGIYGWAIPQAYVEAAMGDWNIKAGHFFTLVGYEVVSSPDNFFYSHAYTMYNSEPFTHTGVLTTYRGIENVELYAGWTAGWDTGFDQNDEGSNFLGGGSLTLAEDWTLTYITTAGDFGARGEGYSHSIVLDGQLTEQLNYVVQSDLVETNIPGDHQVGLNQYLLYKVNDCFGLGTRLEWWKNDGASQYAATFGANYKPHPNVIIRPEIRHDWNPADQNIAGKNNFTTIAADMILIF